MLLKTASKTYIWNKGYRNRVDASDAGPELERIYDARGELTAEIVVEEAKQSSSPLHDQFEWKNKIAAHKYRCAQAGTMIRSLRVISEAIDSEPIPIRVYVHTHKGNESKYITTAHLMSDEEMYMNALEEATMLLNGVRERFGFLLELRSIFDAMDEID